MTEGATLNANLFPTGPVVVTVAFPETKPFAFASIVVVPEE